MPLGQGCQAVAPGPEENGVEPRGNQEKGVGHGIDPLDAHDAVGPDPGLPDGALNQQIDQCQEKAGIRPQLLDVEPVLEQQKQVPVGIAGPEHAVDIVGGHPQLQRPQQGQGPGMGYVQNQPAGRLEHPVQLGHQPVAVLDARQQVADHNRVELLVRKRQGQARENGNLVAHEPPARLGRRLRGRQAVPDSPAPGQPIGQGRLAANQVQALVLAQRPQQPEQLARPDLARHRLAEDVERIIRLIRAETEIQRFRSGR